jgi:ABC-type transport system involved in multi-copper enzyme maturation permease subunit
MIQDAMTIAGDSFRDANRRKGVVLFLLLIAIAQVGVFKLYGEISLGIEDKLLKDVGLGMIALVGILSGLTMAFQIPRELREKTAMTLFAKPLGRESYIIGKWLGICFLAMRNMAIVTIGILCIYVLCDLNKGDFIGGMLQSVLLALVGTIDLIAITLLISLYLSEGISVLIAVIITLVGNLTFGLAHSESGMAAVAGIAKYILPNFYLFDIKSEVAAGLTTSVQYMLFATGYGIAYAVMLTSLSVILFRKRDL